MVKRTLSQLFWNLLLASNSESVYIYTKITNCIHLSVKYLIQNWACTLTSCHLGQDTEPWSGKRLVNKESIFITWIRSVNGHQSSLRHVTHLFSIDPVKACWPTLQDVNIVFLNQGCFSMAILFWSCWRQQDNGSLHVWDWLTGHSHSLINMYIILSQGNYRDLKTFATGYVYMHSIPLF